MVSLIVLIFARLMARTECVRGWLMLLNAEDRTEYVRDGFLITFWWPFTFGGGSKDEFCWLEAPFTTCFLRPFLLLNTDSVVDDIDTLRHVWRFFFVIVVLEPDELELVICCAKDMSAESGGVVCWKWTIEWGWLSCGTPDGFQLFAVLCPPVSVFWDEEFWTSFPCESLSGEPRMGDVDVLVVLDPDLLWCQETSRNQDLKIY